MQLRSPIQFLTLADRVAPYCFLKSGKMANFNFKKVPLGISETNEAKGMHRITFRASNSANGKVFRLLL